jgi:putative nucleotidyltransferase with HDIG domain
MQPLSRRSLIAAGLLEALLALPGCATRLGDLFNLEDAVRRLLTLSSQRAFARLLTDEGFFRDDIARIDLPPQLGGSSVAAALAVALGTRAVQDRLLRLVNSVYYGLSTPVNSIEEAVFYLGVRQIRQLVMVTPIIEDFQKLAGKTPFPWREFWQHCIAVAILTREITSSIMRLDDESDYVAGLVHDVGRIVMGSAFPAHFNAIYMGEEGNPHEDLLTREKRILGIDHTELGALYLSQHQLPELLTEVVRFHHRPEQCVKSRELVAAVHIADTLARFARIGTSGNTAPAWINTEFY